MKRLRSRARAAFTVLVQHASIGFENPATERAYVESRAPALVKASSLLAVFFFCVSVPAFLLKVLRAGRPESQRAGTDFFMVDAGLMALLWAIFALHLVLVFTRVLERRFGCFAREYYAVALASAVLLVMCCMDPHYLQMICSHGEPAGAPPSGAATDTTILMKVDGILTLAHIGLPVRWKVLCALDAAAVIVFGVFAFGLGSPEQESAPQHWFMLLALAVGSLVGKQSIEGHERAAFLNSLVERTRRAELEFELSRRFDAQAAPGGQMEDATSVSPSNATGQLFSDLDASGLHHVARLGLKEHWLLTGEALELAPNAILGRGSFGVVVAGRLHGTPVAVKVPTNPADGISAQRFPELANELRILRRLRNAHIVHFYGACIDFELGTLALVEELVEGPSLEGFILLAEGSGGRPDDAARQSLVLGVCRGLQYLHAQDPCVVHGDLKPGNVHVEQLGTAPRVKLLDFGLSRLLHGNPRPLGGTLRWMAPEVIVNNSRSALPVAPSPAADIFSFGRLAYFIATGVKPLQGYARSDIIEAANAKRVPLLRWPAEPSPFSVSCAPIAEQCMSRDPAARPGIRTVHDDFFRLGRQSEGPDECGGGDRPARPSDECVPWQAGLQRVLASVSQPGGPVPPSAPRGARCDRAPDEPRSEPPRAGDEVPIFGSFRPTPLITLQRMLLWCMMHANVGMRSDQCCKYHAVLEAFEGLCDSLRSRPCNEVLSSACVPGDQCPNCLALHFGDPDESGSGLCSLCDFRIQRDDRASEVSI